MADPMRIAIIDDDPIYQFAFGTLIEMIDPDCDLKSFSDSEVALDYCKAIAVGKEKPFDFIFLDINMPILDGWTFLDEVMKLAEKCLEHPQVYIVSSSVHEVDVARAKSYDMVQDYLVKPLSRNQIEALLH